MLTGYWNTEQLAAFWTFAFMYWIIWAWLLPLLDIFFASAARSLSVLSCDVVYRVIKTLSNTHSYTQAMHKVQKLLINKFVRKPHLSSVQSSISASSTTVIVSSTIILFTYSVNRIKKKSQRMGCHLPKCLKVRRWANTVLWDWASWV